MSPSFSSFQSHLIELSRRKGSSLVLPESTDPRILRAAARLLEQNLLKKLILLASHQELEALAKDARALLPWDDPRLVLAGDSIPELSELAASTYRSYLEKRGKPQDEQATRQWSQHPANQAASLVAQGHCQAALAGCVFTTAEVIRAALQGLGLRGGNRTISGSFAMVRESAQSSERYMFADCGVVIEPSKEQLVDIAGETLATFQQLFPDLEPRVAFLSFSSKGSAQHPSAQKMAQACEMFQAKHPDIKADGELQLDAAIVPDIGQRKSPGSAVAGQANCFIFPNLDAGNLVYKATQRLAGFEAYGPILQGTGKPYSDLSRGASELDIFFSSLITMLRS